VRTLTADSVVSVERALNAAIVNADITRSYEESLILVDQYYAEDVLLLGFLAPLHMVAEIGGLWVSIHEASIAGDSVDEQHSEWSLELIGVTVRRVTQTWCVRRRWKHSRVVSEYHYAHRLDGEALSLEDLVQKNLSCRRPQLQQCQQRRSIQQAQGDDGLWFDNDQRRSPIGP